MALDSDSDFDFDFDFGFDFGFGSDRAQLVNDEMGVERHQSMAAMGGAKEEG